MGTSINRSRAITFVELKQIVDDAQAAGALELDLSTIASELAGFVNNALRIAKLRFETFEVPAITDQELKLAGVIRLPTGPRGRTFDLDVECCFFDSRGGIGYTVIVAPVPGAVHALFGDLKKVIDLLPMDIESLWLTLSSIELPRVDIDIPGQEVADALISKGQGYLFRFKSELLKLLDLESTVFALLDRAMPFQFSTNLKAALRIPPVIEMVVDRVSVIDAKTITVSGTGKLVFSEVALSFKGAIGLSLEGFRVEIPVPQSFVAPFDKAFFRGFRLSNTVATFDGTLQVYTVGLRGDFEIEGSQHAGNYDFKYAPGGTASIPDLFELYAERLSLSDAFTVMSGSVVTLPAFLDRLIALERAYGYYATKPGMKTRSGVSSHVGARMHADIDMLGYKAYGEFEAFDGGSCRAVLLLNPIRLGGIIAISGIGAGTPRSYRGTNVGSDAIRLEVDGQTASGDIKVALFNRASVSCWATMTEESLYFRIDIDLTSPIEDLKFDADLVRDAISLKSALSLAVDIKADWGFGRFHIAKPAQVDARIRITAMPGSATCSVNSNVSLGPLGFSLVLTLDPRELEKLPELLRRQVIEKAIELLKDATEWLQAILDGTIAYVGDQVGELAENIGRELRDTFGKTGKEAAKALKRAGYELEKAYGILEKGQRLSLRDVLDNMCDAEAYAEREIVGFFRRIGATDNIKFTACEVADLLLHNGMSAGKVIKEVQDMVKDVPAVAEVLSAIRRPVHEVAEFLKNAGKTAPQAAELLARVFYDAQKDIINAGMQIAKYPGREASRAVDNVFRESGAGIEKVRDEVRRAWRRYAPRFTF